MKWEEQIGNSVQLSGTFPEELQDEPSLTILCCMPNILVPEPVSGIAEVEIGSKWVPTDISSMKTWRIAPESWLDCCCLAGESLLETFRYMRAMNIYTDQDEDGRYIGLDAAHLHFSLDCANWTMGEKVPPLQRRILFTGWDRCSMTLLDECTPPSEEDYIQMVYTTLVEQLGLRDCRKTLMCSSLLAMMELPDKDYADDLRNYLQNWEDAFAEQLEFAAEDKKNRSLHILMVSMGSPSNEIPSMVKNLYESERWISDRKPAELTLDYLYDWDGVVLESTRTFQSFLRNTSGAPDQGLLMKRLNDRLEELNANITAGQHFLVLIHEAPMGQNSSLIYSQENRHLREMAEADNGKRIKVLRGNSSIGDLELFAQRVQSCLRQWMFE